MNVTPVAVSSIPRVRRGDDADALTAAVFGQLIAALRPLSDAQWAAQTECPGWTVRDMVAHVVGAAQGQASLPMFLRQVRYGFANKKHFDGNDLDAMNEYQIRCQDHLANGDLVSALESVVAPSIAGRRRRAAWLGHASVPLASGGSTTTGMPTKVSMGELCTITYTRDAWTHRLDVARALAMEPAVDAVVDGRIVSDVVADWCTRHASPVELVLTGPAGGHFVQGSAGPVLELDALDFCRVLSGRRPEAPVPDSDLFATRVLF